MENLKGKTTKELIDFVDKNYGGGVPVFGKGAAVRRAIKELNRRKGS